MKDFFSKQSEGYAKFRPQYPDSFFQFILSKAEGRDVAWDCGTGNGQAARELAKYFSKVYATDISKKQINHAYRLDNIKYAIEPAEKSALLNNTVDLVTVSQALHWFDVNAFYAEVKRVCKPQGLLAAWTYQLLQADDVFNEQMDHFYTNTLGKYWDPERKHVDDGYQSIYFPFEEIPTPKFSIEVQWRLAELEGFLKTWSAVQKFISINGYDPVDEFIRSIKPYWHHEEKKNIKFPVCLKLAHVHGTLQNF